MPFVAVRNVLIILLISAVVYWLPGGGTAAAVVASALGTAFACALAWVGVMLYRRFRGDLLSLPESTRLMLYGGVGALVIAGAGARTMLDSAAGAIAWGALVGGAIYALLTVWRRRGLA